MYCSKCGHPNDDNTTFCTNCGAPLTEGTANDQAQPAVQPQAPQQPMPQVQPSTSVPGKGLGIASMVLGIVSLVFFCVLYLAIPCAIVGIILGIVQEIRLKKQVLLQVCQLQVSFVLQLLWVF